MRSLIVCLGLVFFAMLAIASVSSAKDVTLSWDASLTTGVTEYRVYSSTSPTELVQNQAPPAVDPAVIVNETTATLTGLPDRSVIFFAVTASDGSIQSLLSNVVMSPGVILPPGNLGGETILQNLKIPATPVAN